MKPRARQARSAGFDPQVSHPAAVAKMANALGLSPRNCRLESGPQHSSAQVAKRETRCVQTAVIERSWRFDSSPEHQVRLRPQRPPRGDASVPPASSLASLGAVKRHADVVERHTPSAENAGPKGMRVRLPPSARIARLVEPGDTRSSNLRASTEALRVRIARRAL